MTCCSDNDDEWNGLSRFDDEVPEWHSWPVSEVVVDVSNVHAQIQFLIHCVEKGAKITMVGGALHLIGIHLLTLAEWTAFDLHKDELAKAYRARMELYDEFFTPIIDHLPEGVEEGCLRTGQKCRVYSEYRLWHTNPSRIKDGVDGCGDCSLMAEKARRKKALRKEILNYQKELIARRTRRLFTYRRWDADTETEEDDEP